MSHAHARANYRRRGPYDSVAYVSGPFERRVVAMSYGYLPSAPGSFIHVHPPSLSYGYRMPPPAMAPPLYADERTREEREAAKRRALSLLREILPGAAYKSMVAGEMVSLDASNGWTYLVALDGRIGKRRRSKVFKTETQHGHLESWDLPMEDCVAAFITWVRTDPDDLEDKWGCGVIRMSDRTRDDVGGGES